MHTRIPTLLLFVAVIVCLSIPGIGRSAAEPHTPNSVSPASLEQTLYASRAFEEPLVPLGSTTVAEDEALLQAAQRYGARSNAADFSALDAFLEQHPHSPWTVALLTNEGLTYYREGYFDRAIASLNKAWKLGRNEKGTKQKALVDRAIGELIKMHARLGHADQLAALLHEIKGRPLTGPATEWVAGAKEGLWQMRHNPGVAYLCGPMALKHVLLKLDPKNSKTAILDAYRSGPHGVDLATVQKLATKVGLDYRMAYRTDTTNTIPLPAVVHWKVSHYAAVVGFEHGRYHLQDPTFGHDLWITPEALDAESDGYFLIPTKEPLLKSEWVTIE